MWVLGWNTSLQSGHRGCWGSGDPSKTGEAVSFEGLSWATPGKHGTAGRPHPSTFKGFPTRSAGPPAASRGNVAGPQQELIPPPTPPANGGRSPYPATPQDAPPYRGQSKLTWTVQSPGSPRVRLTSSYSGTHPPLGHGLLPRILWPMHRRPDQPRAGRPSREGTLLPPSTSQQLPHPGRCI